MMHLVLSSSDTLLLCDSKILDPWHEIPKLMPPPHRPPLSPCHTPSHKKPSFSPGLSRPLPAPSPSLPSSPWAEGKLRHPTLRDPIQAPASLPAHRVRAPFLAARPAIILLPSLPAQSLGVPVHPLAGFPTQCPLLDCSRDRAPS